MNVNGKYLTGNEYRMVAPPVRANRRFVSFKLVFFRLNKQLGLMKTRGEK